ncbi:MAG: hypothetical protein ABJD68_13625 [Nakamurella sp.]
MVRASPEATTDPPSGNDGGEHSALDGTRKAIPLAMAVIAVGPWSSSASKRTYSKDWFETIP